MTEPSASTRLREIAHDLRRLSPCHRNPERYHELKHDLVVRTGKLADELAGITKVIGVRAEAAPKGPVREGRLDVKGRVVPVVRRARKAPPTDITKSPSR